MITTVLSSNSAAIPSRMVQLREATRQAHARIEGSLPLLDPKLTRARYATVVEALFAFYVELEPLVVTAAGSHAAYIDLGRRAKTSLLLFDLRVLGRTSVEIAAIPRCGDLPIAVTASQAFGILYVLEGATLGGRLIRRSLRMALDIGMDNGAAFFAGYGDETRAMWTRFAEHVDRSAALDSGVMVASAIDTFEKLRCWLARDES